MDLELAEAAEAADRPAPSGPPRLPVSENTPVVQLLTRVVSLQQAQLQQKSTKRINFPPLPTVWTARHVVRERNRKAHRERLSSLIDRAKARWTSTVGSAVEASAGADGSTAAAHFSEDA